VGLGGYLLWTAAAREIRKKYGYNIKLMPVESHGSFFKFIEKDIDVFRNNDDFCLSYQEAAQNGWYVLPLVMNNPSTNYCKRDTPEKAFHRTDKHMISQICEFYDIKNPELRCYLNPDENEKWFDEKVCELFGSSDERFITIEPMSKTNYTPNRAYPFEKWQNIVNSLKDKIPFVQVGNKGSRILKNTIDWTGKTNFKNTAGIIGRSRLFLSSEGGLVHAATAVKTKSLVIVTGYQSKAMVGYPQNINVDISSHGPCGLKIPCNLCKDDADNHDWREIVKIIEKELCL